jgi:hypothetical protein
MLGRGRRPGTDMRCPGCGRAWRAPARFCGRCGAVLAPPERRSRTHAWRAPTGARGRAVAATAATAALLAGLLMAPVGRTPTDDVRPDGSAADSPVVLPDLDTERDRASAVRSEPTGGDGLGVACRPAGCERWRHAGTLARVSPATHQGALVVVFDDRLAALDPATGEERWVAPLEDVQPDPGTGWQLRSDEFQLQADGEDLLVWTSRGFLQLRGPDGAERWSVTLPETRRLWATELAWDTVLVAGSANSASGAIEVVTAFDRRHGTVRWRQRVRWSYDADRDGVLVRDRQDRVALLDPATGHTAFHLEVEDPRWVSIAGGFFVVRGEGPDTVLLDRSTGTPVRRVADVAGSTSLGGEDRGVALLIAGRGETQPARVEVIGDDGERRWEHPVGCCAGLVDAPAGTVGVRVGGDGPPLLLAADDGAVLSPPEGVAPGGLRWLSGDLLLAAGEGTSVLLGRDGSRIALDGHRPRIISLDPLVAGTRRGLLALDRTAAAPAAADRRPQVDGTRWASAPQGTRPVRDPTPRAR